MSKSKIRDVKDGQIVRNVRSSPPPSPQPPFSSPYHGQKTSVMEHKNKKFNKKIKTKNSVRAHMPASVRSKPIRVDPMKLIDKSLKVVVNTARDARGLSPKDAAFVVNILRGMPKDEALKMASQAMGIQLTDKSLMDQADRALAKPEVITAIDQALQDAGVDDALVAGKLREGLDATAFTQSGYEHDDFRTRLGYIQTILKIRGQMGADVDAKVQTINYTSFKDEEVE